MLVAGSKSATLMGMGIPTFLLGYIIIYKNINEAFAKIVKYAVTGERGVFADRKLHAAARGFQPHGGILYHFWPDLS